MPLDAARSASSFPTALAASISAPVFNPPRMSFSIDDTVLVQALGKLGLHTRGDKILEPVRLGLLQRAANGILGYPDLGNLAFVEQSLESAIRDWRRFDACQIEALDPQHQ